MDKKLNREVLARVVSEVTDLRETLNDILNGDPDNEYDLDPDAEHDFVTRVLSNFIGKCEGSYYHSGNDGFFALLGVEDEK